MHNLHHIESSRLGEIESLGQRLAQADHADLIRHLGELAGTRITHQNVARRIRGNDWLGRGERCFGAAGHHCERAVTSAIDTTRHRRIEETRSARGDSRGHFSSSLNRCG